MQNILILILITLLSAQEGESYNFVLKYNEGEKNKYSTDYLMLMAIPGMGDMQIGRSASTIEKYLGKTDGLTIIEENITNMVTTNKIGDNVSPNYDLNALMGVPYKVFIKDDGEIDHIETEQRHFEETLNALKRDTGQQNYFYPFGKNANNISIGDSWSEKIDSVVFYAGEGDLESLMFGEGVYTLNKVKTKKGRRIAYINNVTQMRAELNLLQNGIFMEGTMSGEFKYSFRFDIDAGKVLLRKGSGKMDYEFQMEDKSFRSVINISEKTKKVK
ncbi:MAG: hypothetical protein H8E85_03880 [Candidatus Marinimicrobia bacterium]|nr:hypothetical protein [Candidatus Neomarinimicrobiota bacterium]